MPTAPSIEAFWNWWSADGRGRCDAAVDGGEWGGLTTDMHQLVADIDPGLEWELGAGGLSEHFLCVSAGGSAELRPMAERWLLAAPPSDERWEFLSARRADHRAFESGTTLELGGQQIDPRRLRVGVDVDDERHAIDIELWHPDLGGADPEGRASALLMMLDWMLGEDACERWLGAIELVDLEPPDSIAPIEFATLVEELERSHLEPTYALMSGTMEHRPVIVIARRPLKRVEFPLFDLRIEARLLLDAPTQDGLPPPGMLGELTSLEEDLTERLGESGVLAAVITCDGVRTFHVYCDQEGAAPAIAQGWVAAHPERTIVLAFELDPGWTTVAPFC